MQDILRILWSKLMQRLMLNMMTYKKMKVCLQTASLFTCYDRLDLRLDKKFRCIYCLSDRSLKSDLCFCSHRTYLHVASRLVFSFRLHNTVIRLFSHVTTSYIFKNLNLRKKPDHNFRCVFLKTVSDA